MARDPAEYHLFGMDQVRRFKSWMMKGLSTFLFLIEESTEKESELMMNLLELFVGTI